MRKPPFFANFRLFRAFNASRVLKKLIYFALGAKMKILVIFYIVVYSDVTISSAKRGKRCKLVKFLHMYKDNVPSAYFTYITASIVRPSKLTF